MSKENEPWAATKNGLLGDADPKNRKSLMNDENQSRPLILLVNDAPGSGRDWDSLIMEDRCETILADTADTAYEIFATLRPDLVVVRAAGMPPHEQEKLIEFHRQSRRAGSSVPMIFLDADGDTLPGNREEDGIEDIILFPPLSGQDPERLQETSGKNLLGRLGRQYFRAIVRGSLQHSALRKKMEELEKHHARFRRLAERDLRETAAIQRSFLPQSFPSHPDISMAAVYEPSMQIGGDYYDVIPWDENHWGLVMADIAGHGAAAAVVMALTQMVVKEFGKGIGQPSEALRIFDRKLNANLSSDHYVTMIYGVLDLTTMEFTYASAGHVPGLYYSARADHPTVLKQEPSYPLRTFPVDSYPEYRLALEPGDSVLFYTDGVTDVQNPQGQFFGIGKLLDLFAQHHDWPPDRLAKQILDAAERFREKRERLDDFTLLVVSRKK